MYTKITSESNPDIENSMVRGVVRVVSVEADKIWVLSENQSACGGCAQAKGCGTRLLTGFFSNRIAPLEMHNDFQASLGDRLEVGMPNSTILKVSALVYMLPLLTLTSAAVLGDISGLGDAATALFSLVALVAGFLLAQSLYESKHFATAVVPVFLRKVTAAPGQAGSESEYALTLASPAVLMKPTGKNRGD